MLPPSTLWMGLIIALSSLCWSLSDTSRKRLSGGLGSSAAVFWLALLQAPFFIVAGLGEGWPVPVPGYWLPAAVSLALNILSNVLFIQSVRLAPFSLAIPILSLTPVFSALGGFLLLGEPTSLRQSFGILIIVTATFLLGRSSARSIVDPSEVRQVRKGLYLMAVVALLFALTPVFDKICLRLMPASEHAFWQCLAIAIATGFMLKVRGMSLEARGALGNKGWLIAAVIFAAGALWTQLWSIQFVAVGLFEALKRSFGLVGALTIGSLVFREAITRDKLATVVAIAVGIAILLT